MNPTCDVLENRLAALEGGVMALAVSSGQAAADEKPNLRMTWVITETKTINKKKVHSISSKYLLILLIIC